MTAPGPRSVAVAIVVALGLGAVAQVAHAQDNTAAPTKEQLAQAKQAYLDGKDFFAKGKFDKAVEKFKESYKLSKRPALLFNIALTFEKLGTKDMALFYYKKFLTDTTADDPNRADAEKSAAALEKEVGDTGDTGDETAGNGSTTSTTTTTSTTATTNPDKTTDTTETHQETHKRTTPATAADFQHDVVDEAPPGKPLDITASAPSDAGWTITLYYRGAGDDKFVATEMKPHYHDLYARIPAAKMTGNAVQYYIEVKDAAGAMVTRVGKATSPNVVFLDASAKPQYYPDVDDDGSAAAGSTSGTTTTTTTRLSDDDDNPLAERGHGPVVVPNGPAPEGHTAGGPGWGVGSKNYRYLKWGSTGVAGGTLLLSVTFYVMAGSWASSLAGEADFSVNQDNCGTPPCRTFDSRLADIQATGKLYQSMSRVFFGVAIATGAVAGYVWWKELRSKHHEHPAPAATGLRSFVAAPVASDDFLGGAASLRF